MESNIYIYIIIYIYIDIERERERPGSAAPLCNANHDMSVDEFPSTECNIIILQYYSIAFCKYYNIYSRASWCHPFSYNVAFYIVIVFYNTTRFTTVNRQPHLVVGVAPLCNASHEMSMDDFMSRIIQKIYMIIIIIILYNQDGALCNANHEMSMDDFQRMVRLQMTLYLQANIIYYYTIQYIYIYVNLILYFAHGPAADDALPPGRAQITHHIIRYSHACIIILYMCNYFIHYCATLVFRACICTTLLLRAWSACRWRSPIARQI